MILECFRANTGIQFDSESLKRLGLNPGLLDLCQPAPTSSTVRVAQVEAMSHATEPSDRTLVDPTEESEELEDARSPVFDNLKRKKAWWILEFLPMRFREQILEDGHYNWKYSWKYVFVYSTILSPIHTGMALP
jgi:hypothetical protein